MYSKVTKWGSQMVSYQGGVRYFIETPGDGPEWGRGLCSPCCFPRIGTHRESAKQVAELSFRGDDYLQAGRGARGRKRYWT